MLEDAVTKARKKVKETEAQFVQADDEWLKFNDALVEVYWAEEALIEFQRIKPPRRFRN